MYIRRTQTRNTLTGDRYFTYRLVESFRIDGKVRQRTLLNLGRHFEIPQENWGLLCTRIEELLSGQPLLIPPACPHLVEQEAQRRAAQLLAKHGAGADPTDAEPKPADTHSVDVESLEAVNPRTVGVEALGLWAMEQVGFTELLTQLGLSGPLRSAVVGSIIGRMAAPASEHATHQWLGQCSGLGELLDVDFAAMPLMRLYRASDAVLKHRDALERRLFSRISDLFGFSVTVTLYDLTNTYFEGEAADNPKAAHGRSKEKRSDCPLVTLALVLDGSGFVQRSQSFAGNVGECTTLAGMLTDLHTPQGAMIVMDSGLASEENLQWLRQNGYRYLVVSRERTRCFDPEAAQKVETASGATVRVHKVADENGEEVRLYCHSEGREKKEQAIAQRFASRFEAALQKIRDGLQRPRTEKRITKLWERIGRLKEKSRGVGQHYHIEIIPTEEGEKAADITWEQRLVNGSLVTHPGVYCLRSNALDWDEKTLWRTYRMLTDLEAVFRSLKSELGLRPVYHHKEERVDGHLFMTVLAYQFVQIIRKRLKEKDIHGSWQTLRRTLSTQCRITMSFRRADGRALHVRKSSRAEPEALNIYQALALDPLPGKVKKMLV